MAMGIFSFIETFFFLSLAVSFVLILLLVYHFKQRISLLERKYDTIGCIISDVAKEMTMMKCGFSPMCGMDGGIGGDGICGMSLSYSIPEMRMSRPQDMVQEIQDRSESGGDESEDSEDDESEDGNESESEDGNESESEDGNESQSEKEEYIHTKIVVSDTESVDFEEINVEVIVSEEVKELETEVIEDIEGPEEEDVKKMSISSLKQLVMVKGLTHDSSKMKKSELLQMLSASSNVSTKP
jgi:hypothetical protein